MLDPKNRVRAVWTVQLLVVCLTFFAALDFRDFSRAQGFASSESAGILPEISLTTAVQAAASSDDAIPPGWESYLERDDILKIPPQAHDLDPSWKAMKAAHFSFVAELLALYPADTHFYFLARDSELLYDTARLVTEGTVDSERVHLLNISRANMRDPNLKAYLSENGISEATLKQGKKIVFIDTGFSGTIPRVIAENFPAGLKEKLKTHLIVSANSEHPSSRAFLIHLNPTANDRPGSMHGTIVNYEYTPRATDRSSRIVFSGGRYHPISPGFAGRGADGTVSKEKSHRYRADLREEWQRPETRARFQRERAQVAMVKRALTSEDVSVKDSLLGKLVQRKSAPEDHLLIAHIRDVHEAGANADLPMKWTLDDFGIQSQVNTPNASYSKKNALIAKYPEWAPVLEDPATQIPLLFQNQDWQMIGNLIDASVDEEINRLLIKDLYRAPATGIKKKMQILMIENASSQDTLINLALGPLSEPYAQDMTDLLRLVIEKNDLLTLRYLAKSTFSQPYKRDMTDLLRLVIEKGDQEVLWYLTLYTFSQPHTRDMTDLLRLVIEKSDERARPGLVKYVFSQPHAQTPRHKILRQSLRFKDPARRKAWIEAQWAQLDSQRKANPSSGRCEDLFR